MPETPPRRGAATRLPHRGRAALARRLHLCTEGRLIFDDVIRVEDARVGYLSLHRAVSTLSGGESQRVKMARQLDCDLTGLMYVLDEPSIGLHARDINQLVVMLRQLRDKGRSRWR